MWAFTKYMSEEVVKWIGVIRVVLRSAGALNVYRKINEVDRKMLLQERKTEIM